MAKSAFFCLTFSGRSRTKINKRKICCAIAIKIANASKVQDIFNAIHAKNKRLVHGKAEGKGCGNSCRKRGGGGAGCGASDEHACHQLRRSPMCRCRATEIW